MYQPRFRAVYIVLLLLVLILISTNKLVLLLFLCFYYGELFELMFSCKNDWMKNFSDESEEEGVDEGF